MLSYQLVRDRAKPSAKSTAPTDRRVELFLAKSHDWLLLFISENRKVLDSLLDNRWKIVVSGCKVRPEEAVLVRDRVDQLLNSAFRGGAGRSKKLKQWALEMSKRYPTPTQFLFANLSAPVDPDREFPPRLETRPFPNPWANTTIAPELFDAQMVLGMAKTGGEAFLFEFRRLVAMLSDLRRLREIVRGLWLANASILPALKSQANLAELTENQARAVRTVVQQVEDEMAWNRPHILE